MGIASGEEAAGGATDYECCRFRGSLVALNAANGDQVWRTYTITEEARPIRKNKQGVQQWGPSGAPIWTSPAIGVQHNALYVATGDNYSAPPTANSDAFMAFDLDTGKVLWSRQMTASDAWNTACRLSDKTNCRWCAMGLGGRPVERVCGVIRYRAHNDSQQPGIRTRSESRRRHVRASTR